MTLQREVVNLKSKINTINNNNGILKVLEENKDKKILFWGASLFLENFIKENNLSDYNIIGIIDKNTKNRMFINNYQLYSPDKIRDLKADIIISCVINSHKEVYQQIQQYLIEQDIKIELAKDIFV